MPAAAWSTVVGAVYDTLAAALPTAQVARGRGFTDDTGDVVMVGVQSMDDDGWDSPGSFDQEFHTFGGARAEVGTVNGVAFSRNGDGDHVAATEAAITLIVSLASALKATPGLGITTAGIDYVVAELQTGEIQEMENAGATTALSFVVTYQARLT